MKRRPRFPVTAALMLVFLAAIGACKKNADVTSAGPGGGGTVDPGIHKATIQELESVVFGAGTPSDGARLERLANQIVQELLTKGTEGAKAHAEQVAVKALMVWGTHQGAAADDKKYSPAEAKATWLKLRDDNFAQASWFRH